MAGIDTVGFAATNPGAPGIVGTPNVGDSFTVRNFQQTNNARLMAMIRQGATEGFVRVRSALLHDFVRGIMFTPSETPAASLLPRYAGQYLHPQDVLTVELSGGAAEVDAGALSIYYDDVPGVAARLHSWGDIAGIIKNIKPVEVDFNTSATAGAWVDTVITTTENLLHANTDYAVLGYIVDVAVCAFGVKGIDTGNLRICGPGVLRSEVTNNWFVEQSLQSGLPHIPVINSANAGGIFATAMAVATAAAIKGQLILAELTQNLPS
jgi:hypothetical protein